MYICAYTHVYIRICVHAYLGLLPSSTAARSLAITQHTRLHASIAGAGPTRKSSTSRCRRIRLRALEADDIGVVAANWVHASSTAEQEVARLIATRHCMGVEVAHVYDTHHGDAACCDDVSQRKGAWFYWIESEEEQEEEAKERNETQSSGAQAHLVSWALEDEAGGVGLVYTLQDWRRKGLARWVVSRVIEAAQCDWVQRRRAAPPFAIVADADSVGMRLMQTCGLLRTAALYQLQVGGDEMMEPRFPEEMPHIKVATHAMCVCRCFCFPALCSLRVVAYVCVCMRVCRCGE